MRDVPITPGYSTDYVCCGPLQDAFLEQLSVHLGVMSGTNLVDIPLENRDRSSPLKKLCTAVSLESPDLFRIRGVPCIDRGSDKSRPPVAYEHWNGSGGFYERGGEGDGIKETVNFARPSSVSADTPNFFKVSITI